MKFDLVRPCPECPFRTDIPVYLTSERPLMMYKPASSSHCTNGLSFSCHETTDKDDWGNVLSTPDTQQCAGSLILHQHEGHYAQHIQLAERLLGFDRNNLDMTAPVYKSFEEMLTRYRDEGW